MPLNPNIAMGFQAPQIDSPFNAMARMAQLDAANQESQLNALRMQDLQRQRAQEERFSNALLGDYSSPEGEKALFAASPTKAIEFFKGQVERKRSAADAQRIEAETADKVLGTYRSVLPGIQTPEQMAEWYKRQFEDPRLANSPVRAHDLQAKIAAIPRDPIKFAEFKAQVEMGMDKWLDRNRGIATVPGGAIQSAFAYGVATPPLASSTEARPDLNIVQQPGQRPTVVYSRPPLTPGGKPQVSSATVPDTATQLTPEDVETQKLIAKKNVAYPKVQAAYKSSISKMESLIVDAKKLQTHPGVGGITGLIGGRTPGFTGPARQAEALLEQLKARGTFNELQQMRLSSPTGGALGAVSDKEGSKLEAAFAALSRTQDEKDFRNALGKLIRELEASKKLVAEAFEDDYAYKTAGPAAPTTSATTPANTSAAAPDKLGSVNNPNVIKGQADFNALPSGAYFRGPDNVIRRKP